MALENFTTYTETDPGADITVTATRVTFTSFEEYIDAHVYVDKGVNYFAGNFEIDLTVTRTVDQGGNVFLSTLANLVDDFTAIDTANGDALSILLGGASPYYLILRELDGGTNYSSSSYTIALSTIYYLTFRRDETVGTYGTIYLDIYSNVGRTTLLQTLSVTLHTSKKDFRYLYALQSTGSGNQAINTGYVEAMELVVASATTPTVITRPCTAISGTTATGNGIITDIGAATVTEHGHCWVVNDGASPPTPPTTADSKTTNGGGSLGGFTSSITDLTAGLPYVVRAYATNSAGTSYGDTVTFRAGLPQSQRIKGRIAIKGTTLRYGGYDGVENSLQGTIV